jgi:hypothetical protein
MKNLLFTSLAFAALLFTACKEESENTPMSTLNVRMTDAPGNFDEVNIDLQGVEVTGPGGKDVSLNVTPGIYNLLDFVNGADTLIAKGDIPAGQVSQIRLILGGNNSVMIDSVVYPMATPSAMQSGLKLQIHNVFAAGVEYMLLLDFDANQSVVDHGNGTYSLKPVIRVVETSISGSITGEVLPHAAGYAAIATMNTDTTKVFSSVTDTTGHFLISGVPAGTYTLVIAPPSPMTPDTIFNVNVVNGMSSNVGLIQL